MNAGPPILAVHDSFSGVFAQTEDVGDAFRELLPWLLLLLGLVVVGVLVMVWIRRTFLAGNSGSDDVQGFTLRSLRDMRDRGEISEEEYERARNAMISRVRSDKPASTGDAADKSDEKEAGTKLEPQADSDSAASSTDDPQSDTDENADKKPPA
ncbi:MAG: SHOCT domain-containing protein [Phycisphaerales bacterium]|nr:MAG: SHOCT domain-containing protein [Phycisphaerales bacterium]